MSLRLFVALAPPPEAKLAVAAAQERLRQVLGSSAGRWQEARASHLTLHFLGEVPESSLAAVERAVADGARPTSPFELRTAGYGAFPNVERPSVLWLGLDGELAALHALHELLGEQLGDALGGHQRRQRLVPHLTLLRLRHLAETDRAALQRLLAGPAPGSAAWRVDSVQLLRSHLSHRGARHELLLRRPLLGG